MAEPRSSQRRYRRRNKLDTENINSRTRRHLHDHVHGWQFRHVHRNERRGRCGWRGRESHISRYRHQRKSRTPDSISFLGDHRCKRRRSVPESVRGSDILVRNRRRCKYGHMAVRVHNDRRRRLVIFGRNRYRYQLGRCHICGSRNDSERRKQTSESRGCIRRARKEGRYRSGRGSCRRIYEGRIGRKTGTGSRRRRRASSSSVHRFGSRLNRHSNMSGLEHDHADGSGRGTLGM